MTKRVRIPIDDLLAKSNQGEESARGIVCPECKGVQVSDGRNIKWTRPIIGGVRRKHTCRTCQNEWYTVEK